MEIERLDGIIASAGFPSGDRFTVGCWQRSPIGPFADVMWAPAGGRPNRLLAPTPEVARYITGIYPFGDVRVTPVQAALSRSGALRVVAGDLEIVLTGGAGVPFPPRPRWVTGTIEHRLAGWLLGISTVGTSPTGVREWYRTRRLRWVRHGHAWLGDDDLGDAGPVEPPVGFGFTDPPRRPSIVEVTTYIERSARP